MEVKVLSIKNQKSSFNLYEYAFQSVQHNQKKRNTQLLWVLIGYFSALSCFVTGARIGAALPLGQAIAASLIGNGILFIIVVLLGSIAFDSGWSITFLSRRSLGKAGSILFSLVIILANLYWIASNGNLFSRLLLTAVPEWPLPISLTTMLIITTWAISATSGWKGIELTSRFLVPLILLCNLLLLLFLFVKNASFDVAEFIPTGALSFSAATSIVTGNFICGCTIIPDVYRFAKKRHTVFHIALISVLLGLIIPNISGIFLARLTGSSDFILGSLALGIAPIVAFGGTLCLWTTQDNNIYSASLAMQNVCKGSILEGNLSHRLITILVIGLSATIAPLCGLFELVVILPWLAVIVAPVSSIIIGEHFLIRRSKEHLMINWCAMISWIFGLFTGVLAILLHIPAPPILGMACSFLSYCFLSRCKCI